MLLVAALVVGAAVVVFLAGSGTLVRRLGPPLVINDRLMAADAIVVLGAGAFSGDTLTPDSAYRLVRGTQLLRQGHAPMMILVGSGHRGVSTPDAQVMGTVARALGVSETALLIIPGGETTRRHGEVVAGVVRDRGFRTLVLVTSPHHSRRAVGAFRRIGLAVVSSPGGDGALLTVAQDHLAGRLALTSAVLYEYLAIAIYWSRGWL